MTELSPHHTAYLRLDGDMVIEWFDFGSAVPYESANMLVFKSEAQSVFATRLDSNIDGLLHALAGKFTTYFQVRAFADENSIAYEHVVDFQP